MRSGGDEAPFPGLPVRFPHSDLSISTLSSWAFLFFLDAKSRNSPRSNLKFRFDKLSHASSSAVRTRGREVAGGASCTRHSSLFQKPDFPPGGTSHQGKESSGQIWGDAVGLHMVQSAWGSPATSATRPVLEAHPGTHTGVSFGLLALGASGPFLSSLES